jgi:hypothetical protein
MFNEFELNEFSLDEDEVETPKKKEWADDGDIDNPPPEVEDDDDEDKEEEEAEDDIPV